MKKCWCEKFGRNPQAPAVLNLMRSMELLEDIRQETIFHFMRYFEKGQRFHWKKIRRSFFSRDISI